MKNKLGFGMMRLPVKSGVPTDFDYEQINRMVDEFINAGFTYFDTSYVYHNGKSEEATRKTLVERHPRDSFTVATKFPTFDLKHEGEIEPIFTRQLENLGVDYIDYYLLHNIQTVYYDGIDGNGGIMQACHLFEHAKKWKEEGKIRHLGFSFHSSAKLLDRILTEHPEVEFVQIVLNYYDWESEFVQARKCYEVIRRHGKQVVIMEPVKGGCLALVPQEAEALLKTRNANASMASWALRFTLDLDGVLAVLSGMSDLAQVQENTTLFQNAQPLTVEDKEILKQIVSIYKKNGPLKTADFSLYAGLHYHGVPVSAVLDTYNTCQFQPNPSHGCDNCYLKNTMAEEAHLDCFQELSEDVIVLDDGTDITEMVKKAEKWLIENSCG